MLYACICPLWDIASSARVPSPSNPCTSKHLRSSRMNNYRLSWHNLYTYLMWWAKDICSPEKQLKFQYWAQSFSLVHEASPQLTQLPAASAAPQDTSEPVTEQCHSRAIGCDGSRLWWSHSVTGHSHQHEGQLLGYILTLQEVFVKSAPANIPNIWASCVPVSSSLQN